jgi:hypothetical protein
VWAGGYGAQLGLGVTTVVRSAATYLALCAASLSAGAVRGAVIVGVFGLVRGLQPLATWRVRRPSQLMSFHARLRRWRSGARGTGLSLLAAILALALAGAMT